MWIFGGKGARGADMKVNVCESTQDLRQVGVRIRDLNSLPPPPPALPLHRNLLLNWPTTRGRSERKKTFPAPCLVYTLWRQINEGSIITRGTLIMKKLLFDNSCNNKPFSLASNWVRGLWLPALLPKSIESKPKNYNTWLPDTFMNLLNITSYKVCEIFKSSNSGLSATFSPCLSAILDVSRVALGSSLSRLFPLHSILGAIGLVFPHPHPAKFCPCPAVLYKISTGLVAISNCRTVLVGSSNSICYC